MPAPKIHHLNCATMCPPFARALVHKSGVMICHCLLVESNEGLILVDTGIGLADVEAPKARLGRAFLTFIRPRLDPAECAVRQVEKLGFKAADVKHIVITHLDLDHAGGLPDFPDATVHIFAPEHEAAMARADVHARNRYRPPHWAHEPKWKLHRVAPGERWEGFESVRALDDRWPEVLIVPLTGHSAGHSGVAVREGDAWWLHCGDAYFHKGELDEVAPKATPGIAAFERALCWNDSLRRENQRRIRELARTRAGAVHVFSAHDPEELDEARSLRPV